MNFFKPCGVIYGLYDRTGLRYVGQTTQPVHARLARHLKARGQNHRTAWIRSLVLRGEVPELRVLDVGYSRAQLDRLEIKAIANARALGHDLVNALPGGRSTVGYKHTPKSRAKIRAAHDVERRRALRRARRLLLRGLARNARQKRGTRCGFQINVRGTGLRPSKGLRVRK